MATWQGRAALAVDAVDGGARVPDALHAVHGAHAERIGEDIRREDDCVAGEGQTGFRAKRREAGSDVEVCFVVYI